MKYHIRIHRETRTVCSVAAACRKLCAPPVRLQVVNRGRVAALVSLAPCLAALRDLGIEALPAGDLLLRPRETCDLTFCFRCGDIHLVTIRKLWVVMCEGPRTALQMGVAYSTQRSPACKLSGDYHGSAQRITRTRGTSCIRFVALTNRSVSHYPISAPLKCIVSVNRLVPVKRCQGQKAKGHVALFAPHPQAYRAHAAIP